MFLRVISLFLALALALAATLAHHGFDRLKLSQKLSLNTTHYMHYLHHKYFRCNYADGAIPLDKWFGSFHDGTHAAQEAINARSRTQAAAKQARAAGRRRVQA